MTKAYLGACFSNACMSAAEQAASWVALALTMSCLTSCSSGSAFIKTPELHTVQDAASVNVTALSIAPWENYVDTLQMQFALTPIDALALALPQTNVTQQNFADALALGLQVGLPQTTTNQTLTTNNSQNVTAPAASAPASSSTTGEQHNPDAVTRPAASVHAIQSDITFRDRVADAHRYDSDRRDHAL
jgi:hypothetical protein